MSGPRINASGGLTDLIRIYSSKLRPLVGYHSSGIVDEYIDTRGGFQDDIASCQLPQEIRGFLRINKSNTLRLLLQRCEGILMFIIDAEMLL